MGEGRRVFCGFDPFYFCRHANVDEAEAEQDHVDEFSPYQNVYRNSMYEDIEYAAQHELYEGAMEETLGFQQVHDETQLPIEVVIVDNVEDFSGTTYHADGQVCSNEDDSVSTVACEGTRGSLTTGSMIESIGSSLESKTSKKGRTKKMKSSASLQIEVASTSRGSIASTSKDGSISEGLSQSSCSDTDAATTVKSSNKGSKKKRNSDEVESTTNQSEPNASQLEVVDERSAGRKKRRKKRLAGTSAKTKLAGTSAVSDDKHESKNGTGILESSLPKMKKLRKLFAKRASQLTIGSVDPDKLSICSGVSGVSQIVFTADDNDDAGTLCSRSVRSVCSTVPSDCDAEDSETVLSIAVRKDPENDYED